MSSSDVVLDLDPFRASVVEFIRTIIEMGRVIEDLRRTAGYETPRASAMHTAYRTKTRRRNRRR